jgi:hypothetical protein
LADTLLFNVHELSFTSLGTAFIASTMKDGKVVHTFFSNQFPKGKILSIFGDYTVGVNGFIDFRDMDEYIDLSGNSICIFLNGSVYILDKSTAKITPVQKEWVLLKDYGWIHNGSPLSISKDSNYFRDHIFEYMDKLIFLTPKKQYKIYDGSKFYDLNIKSMKK